MKTFKLFFLTRRKNFYTLIQFILILTFPFSDVCAQPMGSGNLTTCSANIFDSGGAGSDYSDNEFITETYCSNSASDCITITFTVFQTQAFRDVLNIYDGPNNLSPLIGSYDGSTSPGTISGLGSCLTFEWQSDGGTTNIGWEAIISCSPCPNCTDGILNGLEIGIDCGGPTCPPCPCSALPIANDEVCCATPVIVNTNQNCSSVTAGTVANATPSFNSNICLGSSDDDVWFSFVATNATHFVDLLNVSGSATDMFHAVYGGTCSAIGIPLICNDLNNSMVSGLTPGNTYFIRVYTVTSTTGQNTIFDVCVGSPPPPPSNDEPCIATPATVNPDPTCNLLTPGYCIGSTQTMSGCSGTADDDVWFSFVALSTEQNVSIMNITGTTDMVHQVFSGSCSSLTSIGCSDPNNSSYSSLTVGDTYFVRVYTFSSSGQNTSFDLCINSPCGLISTPPDCGLDYTHSTIPYNPANYNTGTQYFLTDDTYASSFTSLGFDFCYDGVTYQDIMVSSNGFLIFPGCFSSHNGNDIIPGNFSGWSINSSIPNSTNAPQNAILGVWQDMNPSSGGSVRTSVQGTAPNRVFIAKYFSVAMFSCTFSSYTGQIMLYETSNNIEIHIEDKPVCFGWNSGAGIMGLNNFDGTIAVSPAGYNFPSQWTVPSIAPEGHLFESNCAPAICLIILPAELISFNAKALHNSNQLSWVTASEKDIDYFVIEKSINGQTFIASGKTEATGNTTQHTSYEFTDLSINNSTTYYRLRMVDKDGKVAYSKIIALERKPASSNTLIFPNPASDNQLNIKTKDGEEVLEIYLISQTGRKIKLSTKNSNSSSLRIGIQGISRGSYFLEIIYKNGFSVYKKLIIN
jgi:hypothetical protein